MPESLCISCEPRAVDDDRPRTSWRFILATGLLIASVTFIAFWRTLSADFVLWDDNAQLTNNPKLGGLSLDTIVWALTDVDSTQRYEPLTLLGWVLTFEIAGLNPFAFHLGNVLLHCGSTVFMFLAIRRLLISAAQAPCETPATTLIAALAALLWAIHPMRVEPVAWCTTRSYCQAMFFLSICLWLYTSMFDRTMTQRARTIRYWSAVFAYALSLLSYPLALTLPLVLLVVDLYLRRAVHAKSAPETAAPISQLLIQKVPFALIAGLALAAGLWARFQYSTVYKNPVAPLSAFGIPERLSQAAYLVVYYLWRPFWPIDLSPVRTDLVTFTITDWLFVASAASVVGITTLLLLGMRQWPAILALWMFHVVALLPVLGWTEHPHFPTDRYSYWQGLVWPLALAAGLHFLWRRNWVLLALPLTAAAIFATTVCGWLTTRQSSIWDNSVTLFTHMINVLGDDPYRHDIYRRLGVVYTTTKPPRWADAEAAYRAGLDAKPDDDWLRVLLAEALAKQEKYEPAIALLREGIALTPQSPRLRYQLGVILAWTGRYAQAITQFEETLRLDPDFPQAQDALRTVIEQQRLESLRR